jgi:pimeloyl-ACP methyl ester carboxylesterase
MKTPTDWIPSGNARIAAWAAGTGPLVALLHAGVADSRMWRGQFAALARRARVVAFDRRGFGQTARAPGDYTQVADLLAVLDTLAPGQPALLVGCSQGGRIAIDTALLHPARVAGLVLIGPGISGGPAVPLPPAVVAFEDTIAAADAAGDKARVNALEAWFWLDGPQQPEGRVAGPLRDLFLDMNAIALAAPALGRALPPPSAYDRLEQVLTPTLVTWGTIDAPDVIAYAEAIAQRVPAARHQTIPGAAHLPSMEAPDVVLAMIEGELARL